MAIQNFVEVSADERRRKEKEEAVKKLDVMGLLLDHMDGGLDGSINHDIVSNAGEEESLCITEITKQEFVLYMLKTTKAVSEGEVGHWEKVFSDLDNSGDGKLSVADVRSKEKKDKEEKEGCIAEEYVELEDRHALSVVCYPIP